MKKSPSFRSTTKSAAVAIASIFALAATQTVQASSSTWGGATGAQSWSVDANWTASAPGSTSTTNSTDSATFNQIGTATTITVDPNRNVQNITFANSGTGALGYTFSGGPLVLTAGGSIAVSGTSAATFTAPLVLEGNYALASNSGALLTVGTGGISSATTGTILTLTGTNAGNNIISGAISDGSGQISLDKESTGNWILTGTNTYTGSTTVNGGVLQIGNNTASSIANTSFITVGTAGTLALNLITNSSFNQDITDNGTVRGGQTGNLTINGTISGTGGFSQTAAGTTILTATNTYTGPTTISSGTVQVGNGTSGSITTSGIVFVGNNSGTLALDMASGSTYSGNLDTGTRASVTDGTIKAIQSGTLTITGTISDFGFFTQAGTGTTILTASNTYQGGLTTISGGTLEMSGTGTMGAVNNNLVLTGTGTLDLNNTAQSVGLLTGTNGTSILNSGGGSSTLSFGNNIAIAGAGQGTGVVASTISTNVNLIKNGFSQQLLTATNSYTGTTTVAGGQLEAVDGIGLPTGSTLILNGGTYGTSSSTFTRVLGNSGTAVELTGGQSGFSADMGTPLTIALGGTASPTAITWGQGIFNPSELVLNGLMANNVISFENALDLNGQNRTILTAANVANLDGAISSTGGGGFNFVGAGNLNLTSNNNTYTGGTSVSGGLLTVASNSSIGKGGALIGQLGELRLSNASNVASGQKIVVGTGGVLGIGSSTFTPAVLSSLVDPSSSGVLALDTSYSSNLDMTQIGNGNMTLGSSTSGVYSGTSLTVAEAGVETGGIDANFGTSYHLGAGGGTLTITGSNVLTDGTPTLFLSNSNNDLSTTGADGSVYSATSNTRNALQVGQYGAKGAGTLDLANSQSFTGITTVNPGSTLALDFSGTLTGTNTPTSNILNSGNEVDLNNGNLTMIGSNGATATSQTLSRVGLSGANSITATQPGSGTATLNLGVIGNGAAGSAISAAIGGTALVQGNGTVTTTSGLNTSDGVTLGGSVIYKSASGAYTWASGTSSGPGVYTIGAYTGDTANVLPTSAAVATKDYIMTANTTLAANETVNLLRITAGSLSGAASPNKLVVNSGGVIITGTTGLTLAGNDFMTSGTAANGGSYNFLNIYNYNTGGVNIGNSGTGAFSDNGTTKTVVVLGGTGTYGFQSSGGVNSNTGGYIFNGSTVNLGAGSTVANDVMGPGTITVNSGTTIQAFSVNGSGNVSLFNPWVFNGNFTMGALGHNGTTVFQIGNGASGNPNNVTLGNNIVLTVNVGTNSFGRWGLGNIVDGGYGYGLTINYLSGMDFSFNGTADTFTGPLNLENNGSNGTLTVNMGGTLIPGGQLNRNIVLNMGPNVTLSTQSNSLAGLNDLGLASSTETVTNNTTSSALTFFGSGNYSFGGNIVGTTALVMDNAGGTQALTGSNSFTGLITSNAGTLLIDNSQGGSLSGTSANALTFGGGTVEVKGSANGTSARFGNITNSASGNSTLIVDGNGGATTVALGTMGASGTGSTLNIVAKGSVAPTITTATAANNAVGTLGTAGHIVYTDNTGKTTWATVTSTGPTTGVIGAYGGDTTNLVQAGGVSTTNYQLTGSQTQTGAVVASLLRIANTSAGSLDLNGKGLSINNTGVLFNGSASYSIVDSVGTGSINGGSTDLELLIQNYGTGSGTALTIGATIANAAGKTDTLTISGPGKTILTATNTYGGATTLNGPGIVNINNNANFGSASTGITFNGATLQYATGTTIDFTAGTTTRAMTFNASGGTIDTNGNKETFSSTTTIGTGIGGLTVTDSTGTGSLQINGVTGYTGNTIIKNGGDLILGSNASLGGSQTLGGATTIVGSGGTLQGGSTMQVRSGIGTSKAGVVVLQSGGVIAPGAGLGTQVIQGTGLDNGNNGSVSNQVQLNVLTATSLTFNPGGTIKFELDSTDPLAASTGAGTAINPYASTQLNLGQGALVKGNIGVGQFVLDFGNTGTWDPNNSLLSGNPDGFQNVYDLINFGVTNTYGVLSPNTNFNINDFSIENLSGIGTLSFWYNSSTGQEELLLTVVPEPSTWAMLIGGLAALIFWTRKRNRLASFSKR